MKGTSILLFTAVIAMSATNGSTSDELFHFDRAEQGNWTTVHDTVMGGRSGGAFDVADGILQFTGNLSLENNGGFASIRRVVDLDLSGKSGVRLRVRGDGRTYQLRLHTDSRYYGRPVAYSGDFATQANRWMEIEVPFDQLRASFRGRQLADYEFDPGQVQLVGILLGDKQPGPFSLEIERIAAY